MLLISSRNRKRALHSLSVLALAAASFQRGGILGGSRHRRQSCGHVISGSRINNARGSYFLSLNQTPSSLQFELLEQAAQVREKQDGRPPSYADSISGLERVLFFSSSFAATNDKLGISYERGFCNWILPGKVMVGQYPGQTPEVNGPSSAAVEKHLQTILLPSQAPIRLFCSLQSELPAQDDYESWDCKNGVVFLEPESVRRRFPGPFTHYAPLIKDVLTAAQGDENDEEHVTFLHSPIGDLDIPESQEPFQMLLLELLTFLNEHDNTAIYIHCWGGRGRGGLVGACLLSLIYPTLDSPSILDWIQTGYASRLGHDQMPLALSRSPQTDAQQEFVRKFVHDYQTIYSKNHQQR
jgi:hypothetical protein